jgi:hypothetical protein
MSSPCYNPFEYIDDLPSENVRRELHVNDEEDECLTSETFFMADLPVKAISLDDRSSLGSNACHLLDVCISAELMLVCRSTYLDTR